jgi:glutamate/tyrosine decarboxylase-like PLP-dependent enzyme
LRYHGLAAFRAAIQLDLAHAQRLAQQITAHAELELMAPVDLSAVCFRYRGTGQASDNDLNQVNPKILKRVIDRGRVYLSNASLRNRFCLRACVVNHRTTDADIDSVVAEALQAALEVAR